MRRGKTDPGASALIQPAVSRNESVSRRHAQLAKLTRNGIRFCLLLHQAPWSAMRPRVAFKGAQSSVSVHPK
jgi:hypothetical protein